MSHYNIEFSHIYVDEEFGAEHLKGAEIARELSLDLATAGATSVAVILIDEYHPVTQSLIMTDFLDFLEGHHILPHFIMMEGNLRELSYQLLYSIPKSKRKDLSRYMEKKDNFPCSLLTATWYLMRLGLITASHIKPIRVNGGKVQHSFCGNKLINILPKRFQEVEERVKELLKSTPWSEALNQIEWEWI